MPAAQIVAIEPLVGRPSLLTPILEIAGGGVARIFMIAQGGFGAVLESPPRRVIAILELFRDSPFVGQVTRSEYSTWDPLDELGSCVGALQVIAGGDITRANQCESLGCGGRLQILARVIFVRGCKHRACGLRVNPHSGRKYNGCQGTDSNEP